LLSLKQDEVKSAASAAEEAPKLMAERTNRTTKKQTANLNDVTKTAMAALGKELVYEGRLQQEEASREKKQEMRTALILETAKAKLVKG